MSVEMGRCRWRGCGRDVQWVLTENGRKMPIDPMPNAERGTVVLVGERKIAKVLGSPEGARAYIFLHEGSGPYVAHKATCKGSAPKPKRRQGDRGAAVTAMSDPTPAPDPQLQIGGLG